jgi:hypothetical protein
MDLRGGIYVDVGANHPTSISNTFLLYRHGLHGVTIEPNPELSQLHRRFRRRDVVVSVGSSKACPTLQLSYLEMKSAAPMKKLSPCGNG